MFGEEGWGWSKGGYFVSPRPEEYYAHAYNDIIPLALGTYLLSRTASESALSPYDASLRVYYHCNLYSIIGVVDLSPRLEEDQDGRAHDGADRRRGRSCGRRDSQKTSTSCDHSCALHLCAGVQAVGHYAKIAQCSPEFAPFFRFV